MKKAYIALLLLCAGGIGLYAHSPAAGIRKARKEAVTEKNEVTETKPETETETAERERKETDGNG